MDYLVSFCSREATWYELSVVVVEWALMLIAGNWKFVFRAPVPGYQMDGYIRASGFVLYPYLFVMGPKRGDFCHLSQSTQPLSEI